MAVDSPFSALFFCIIGIGLLMLYGMLVELFFYGKSNNTEKVGQQKSTLARHDESFISGMMWSDVGRGS